MAEPVHPDRTSVLDADAALVRGEEAPSQRRRLDRDRIVTAGLDYIDQDGLAGLSMRRLGSRLGVEAMALYRYVPSKEHLLDAIVESMISDMRADEGVPDSPTHGWQDFLQRLAHGVRRVALAHPKAFPLVVSRPAEAPWLRPPLRSLAWVEMFLDALRQEGFRADTAVAAYRAFTSFLLGHLLLEVAAHGADLGPLDVLADDEESSLQGYPRVAEAREMLAEDHAALEFEEALETLLERLHLLLVEQ